MTRRDLTIWAAALLAFAGTVAVCSLAPVRADEAGTRAALPDDEIHRSLDAKTTAPTKDEPYDWAKWREFWSFRPVRRPTPPAVKDSRWVSNPIDQFVLAGMEAAGLSPAREADRYTLIRRLTFDLTGLPPTPEEIRAFVSDKSPDAYEKVVDRLLASPHYGERWGRHWLDVARWTPARISFPGIKNTRGDQAYRDYVVRAFNNDKPFDQFLTEQLAGDLLPATQDRQQYFDQITAPAFLSIGPWFDMETDPNRLRLEMVDEMIATTSQAFLGLTVQCARCHDHKFDPIPTADYYALGGVFGSTRLVGNLSEFWRDGRVRQLRPLAMPEQVEANDRVRRQIDDKKAQRTKFLAERHAELMAEWKAEEGRYRAAAKAIPAPEVRVIEAENFDGQDNLRIAQLMRDGRAVEVIETQTPLAQWVKYKVTVPQTGRWRMEALYSADEPTPVDLTVNGDTPAKGALNVPTGGWDLSYQRWDTLADFELRKGLNFFRIVNKGGNFPRIDKLRLVRVGEGDTGLDAQVRKAAEAQSLDTALLARFVIDPQNPWPTPVGVGPFLNEGQRKVVEAMTAAMAALEKAITPYEQVVAVTDQARPADMPVHLKGETYAVAKEPTPRGAPRLFDQLIPRSTVPVDHSGRLELAHWMTDRRNPLVSRVMANRVWDWHFGRGIVKTTSDFCTRGEPPANPELLDWLACELMENGWSIKHLHRLIVTSSTYRQSSDPADATALQRDPENKLLSHFGRRRLEVEAIYDAMRSTTNMIPRQEPGKPLDVDKAGQRMMYILTNGRSPMGMGAEVRKMYPLFDCELSGAPLAVRRTSTTPAQALFFLNNPLPKYLADRFADRLLRMTALDDRKRLDMAHLLALGRPPSKELADQSLAYLKQCEAEKLTKQQAWSNLCQALFATAEFRYID